MNIYLAGKVSKNDWRHDIVDDLKEAGNQMYDMVFNNDFKDWLNWPILKNSIFVEHNYVGPYFIRCDHGCYHGQDHGWGDGCGGAPEIQVLTRLYIAGQCKLAIEKADLVFAWVDDQTAYGTLAEIGYAYGLKKSVFVYSSKDIDEHWLAWSFSDGVCTEFSSPTEALRHAIQQIASYEFESPMEAGFYSAASDMIPGLVPQFVIKPYRVDFALPHKKIVIEVDGHDYHKTKKQRTNDAERQRFLEMSGWHVIRFTGSEIYRDATKCAIDAKTLIEKWAV